MLTFGAYAGQYSSGIQSANRNTFIGAYSGPKILDNGSDNVFIGYGSGTQGSNKLHISNSVTETPLIYGEFDSNGGLQGTVHIHGTLQSTNFKAPLQTVTNSNDPGIQGTVLYDGDYMYFCIATDTWKRASLGTW